MSVKFTDNTKAVMATQQRRVGIAFRLMLDDIDRAANPGTPKDKGDLRKNKIKRVVGLHATIAWLQKYAADQEDVQHSHYTTAGTGPHFAENAVRQVVKNAAQYFKRASV